MLKKLDLILNTIIGSFIGVWIGNAVYTYWDYKAHPGLFALTSFPWYTSIQAGAVIVAVVVGIAVVLKLIIRKKMKG